MLSFVFIGIYWNNHHHLLHAVEHVTGGDLWANLHLLFWLSLVPFVTGWMGENNFAPLPVAISGGVLLCAAFAYTNLQLSLIRTEGRDSTLARAMGARLERQGLARDLPRGDRRRALAATACLRRLCRGREMRFPDGFTSLCSEAPA